MNIYTPIFSIDEVMEALPARLRSAKNVRIIMNAWMEEFEELERTFRYMQSIISIDEASGALLNQIANNFNISRIENETDQDLTFRIKLKVASVVSSGSSKSIKTITRDMLNISEKDLDVQEFGNARVDIIVNRGVADKDKINKASEISNELKPLGVAIVVDSMLRIELLEHYERHSEIEGMATHGTRMVRGYKMKSGVKMVGRTSNMIRGVKMLLGETMKDNDTKNINMVMAYIDNVISVDIAYKDAFLEESDELNEASVLTDTYDIRVINRKYN